MTPFPLPTEEADTKSGLRMGESSAFASWFSAIGFVVGGCAVFFIGLHSLSTPPPPPSQANCGNAVFGGAILMLVGTPLGACASAAAGWLIGRLLDAICHGYK